MSELDFEEEIIEEPSASLQKGSVTGIEHEITMNDEKLSWVEELNKDTAQINSKTVVDEGMSDGEIKSESDAGELSDLEEGEINDPISSVNNNIVCRFFLRGTCNHGSQCRFLHLGDSAYRMLGTTSTKRVVHFANRRVPSFCYPPPKPEFPDSISATREEDNWDRALQEAKAMMLNAKNRKETDVEFEKKKLYASCEENKAEKDAFYNSNGNAQLVESKNKHKQSSFAFKSNGHGYAEKENKLKRNGFHSKSNVRTQDWVDPWRRSRSRTRRSLSHSSYSSQSSGHHCSSVSSSSTRSLSRSPEKKSHRKKRKSKFDRMHSRSRSRKRSRSSSLPYSSRSRSYSRGKSSFSSSRSRSRSSSASSFSKIYSSEYLPPKPLSPNAREKSPSHQSKKRKLNSPLQEIKAPSTNLAWEIDSSDITVSCISCTSLSCSDVSSVSDNGSVKQSKTENTASSVDRDIKLLSGESRLKETRNNDCSRTNTCFKNDENVQTSKKKRSSEDYSSRIYSNPVDERAYSKQSDEYYSDYKHHKKSHEKLSAEKVTGELPKYHVSNELNCQMDNVAYNKAHALSPKLSDKQGYSTKKSISLNLKSKSSVSDKSHNVFIESPIKIKQPLSRREQLLKQLQAVELAIAKKKQN